MRTINNIDLAVEKITAALQQVEQLKSAEFPYKQPKLALDAIESLFRANIIRLEGVRDSSDAHIIRQACYTANDDLASYHKVLGFILRSTNVRNAFEIYEPLLRLCRDVCGIEARLILSSEWSFSPFTYPAVFQELPDLIFIGLPATEAQNALIVPLAGHELGHSVWRLMRDRRPRVERPVIKALEQALSTKFQENWPEFQRIFEVSYSFDEFITKTANRTYWSRALAMTRRHCEEIFCDILGLRLFGESYLHAFLYVISPHLGARQSHYPSLQMRVSALLDTAQTYQFEAPRDFELAFSEPVKNLTEREAFLLRVADQTSMSMIGDLKGHLKKVADVGGVYVPNPNERDRIAKEFHQLSPAVHCKSIADVINAAWKIKNDSEAWKVYEFDTPRKREVLNDLVLKTTELIEYEYRMNRHVKREGPS